MTRTEIDALMKGAAPVLKAFVEKQLRARQAEMLAALGKTLASTRSELRAEMHEELNILRLRMNLPIVTNGKAAKPRIRIPHRLGARL